MLASSRGGNMGDGRFSRQAARDQMAGCRCLSDTVGAGAAGIFRAHGHDDTQLSRDDVQPFRAIFADLVHDTTAARADQAGGFNDFFDAG